MLKAHLVKTRGLSSIYYSDNPDRTIALEDCLKKIFTNEKSPLRVNMRELITFRNTNTHFITDEYELFYGHSCRRRSLIMLSSWRSYTSNLLVT